MYVSPNPFGVATTIYFELENADTASLYIFNISGQNVREIFKDSFILKGKHSVYFVRDGLPESINFVSLILASSKDLTAKIIIANKASINLISTENRILIYPNPVKDLLTINTQNFEGKVTKISLFDMLGKEIILENYDLEDQEIQLKISNISCGNYILKIQTEHGIVSKKIIKTN